MRILHLPGGFMVRCEEGSGRGMVISDYAGRVIASPETVSDGEIFMLPAGLYVISAPSMRPVRVIVGE